MGLSLSGTPGKPNFGHQLLWVATAHTVLPAVLFASKLVEVSEEGGRLNASDALERAAVRRLDDASFWGVVAVTVAMFLIARSVQGMTNTLRLSVRTLRSGSVGTTWLAFAVVGVGAYLAAAAFSSGTFFHTAENTSVRAAQLTEGLVHVVSILIGNLYMAVGLVVARRLRPQDAAARRSLTSAVIAFYMVSVVPMLILPWALSKMRGGEVSVEPMAVFLVATVLWVGVIPLAAQLFFLSTPNTGAK